MTAAQTIVNNIVKVIINPAILVIFSLGFLIFVWGLLQFLMNLNSGGKTDDGKQHMIYGMLGMFIMVSVYGIIAIISNTLGLGINPQNPSSFNPTTSSINVPCFGNSSGC